MLDTAIRPESQLLLPELLQYHVSNGTTIGDGPASDTELC